ncbi:hypothetical protein [Winogradskyella aurantia]|uniref:hypothetical protein n=1 Tax=Winogradskyella aurantia TaxID=1915063 RepID=UPI0013FDD824|nr:hypothetical protein [Winogradskyella aurantia]
MTATFTDTTIIDTTTSRITKSLSVFEFGSFIVFGINFFKSPESNYIQDFIIEFGAID